MNTPAWREPRIPRRTPQIELTEAALGAAADDAITAFEAATTLDELTVARCEHLGEQSLELSKRLRVTRSTRQRPGEVF